MTTLALLGVECGATGSVPSGIGGGGGGPPLTEVCPTDDCPTAVDLYCADFDGASVCAMGTLSGNVSWTYTGWSCVWEPLDAVGNANGDYVVGDVLGCGYGTAGYWWLDLISQGGSSPWCQGYVEYERAADGDGDLADGLYSKVTGTGDCDQNSNGSPCLASENWPTEITLYS